MGNASQAGLRGSAPITASPPGPVGLSLCLPRAATSSPPPLAPALTPRWPPHCYPPVPSGTCSQMSLPGGAGPHTLTRNTSVTCPCSPQTKPSALQPWLSGTQPQLPFSALADIACILCTCAPEHKRSAPHLPRHIPCGCHFLYDHLDGPGQKPAHPSLP